jgi:acetyltransferase-like isoleucine patch superfamily enzyme
MGCIREKIESSPRLKAWVHWLLVPAGESRPRTWVRLLVNPFVHHRAWSSKVRWRTRMDVMPFRDFRLEAGAIVEDFCTINNGVGDVVIERDSIIGIGSVLIGPVHIESDVMLAQYVICSGLNHNYEDIKVPISKQSVSTKEIRIGSGSWIAANSVVTAGVSIGKNCVVAAGSVVTKDIPDYCVAAGNPAKVIKRFDLETGDWVREKKKAIQELR